MTPDGERTMNTYLGACQNLTPADVTGNRPRRLDRLSRGLSLGPARREGGFPQGGNPASAAVRATSALRERVAGMRRSSA